MQVQQWPIDRPIPYERNARTISEKAVAKVAASLREFGWQQPIVVDAKGVIVAGHTRLRAAQSLGISHVPVVVADALSPAQIRAYRLMDNRSHEEAKWDLDLLSLELGELKSLDISLDLTGFDLPELEGFLATGRDDERANEAPPLPENPVSRLGDVWVLGKHRVLCGDSTDAAQVAGVIGDAKPLLMVTDPPYGVEYDAEWRNDAIQAGNGKGAPGGRAIGKVSNDNSADWRTAYRLFAGNVAYVWHAGVHAGEVAVGLSANGFEIRAQIIWAKSHIAISRGHYHWQHEPCWYAVRKAQGAQWAGDRKQSTLWMVPKPQKSETGHSTQKPVELMRRPILNHTKRGEFVYDPFLGSGTTLIAAEELERVCYGIEIDPKYVDVIVQRWQTFTGKAAGLDEDGRTFDQVATDRLRKRAA